MEKENVGHFPTRKFGWLKDVTTSREGRGPKKKGGLGRLVVRVTSKVGGLHGHRVLTRGQGWKKKGKKSRLEGSPV